MHCERPRWRAKRPKRPKSAAAVQGPRLHTVALRCLERPLSPASFLARKVGSGWNEGSVFCGFMCNVIYVVLSLVLLFIENIQLLLQTFYDFLRLQTSYVSLRKQYPTVSFPKLQKKIQSFSNKAPYHLLQ